MPEIPGRDPKLNLKVVGKLVVPLDQAVYSCATFAANILAARSLPAVGFGVFALAFTLATLVIGLQRATFCEPLLILSEGYRRDGAFKNAVAWVLGFSSLIGFAFALALIAALAFTQGRSTYLPLLLLVFAPFVQDATRFVFIAAGRQPLALVSDLVCSVSQIGFMLSVSRIHVPLPEIFLAAWAFGGLVGPALLLPYGYILLKKEPSLKKASRGESWALGKQFGLDYLLGIATIQGTLLAATAVTGSIAAAALRGADTLVGPFRILLASAPAFLLPTWSRGEAQERGLIKPVLLFSAPVCVLALAWTAVLLFIPPQYGRALMGDSWLAIRKVLPLVLLSLLPITVTTFSAVALKALRGGRQIVMARLALLPVGLTLGCGGAMLHGAVGAAAGSLATSVIAGLVWFGTLVRAQNMRRTKAHQE